MHIQTIYSSTKSQKPVKVKKKNGCAVWNIFFLWVIRNASGVGLVHQAKQEEEEVCCSFPCIVVFSWHAY